MKLYFVEVQTYLSVNTMMKNIGQWVFETYHHCIISSGMWQGMIDTIKEKMESEKAKFHRCKPIKMVTWDSQDNGGETKCVSVKPENNFNDNFSFILTGKEVKSVELDAIELNGFIHKLTHTNKEGGGR